MQLKVTENTDLDQDKGIKFITNLDECKETIEEFTSKKAKQESEELSIQNL